MYLKQVQQTNPTQYKTTLTSKNIEGGHQGGVRFIFCTKSNVNLKGSNPRPVFLLILVWLYAFCLKGIGRFPFWAKFQPHETNK